MRIHNRSFALVALTVASTCCTRAMAQSADSPDTTSASTSERYELELGPNVGTQPRPLEPAPAAKSATSVDTASPSRFHATFALNVTNAYFFRGIRSEDRGVIFQPSADLAFDVFRSDEMTISLLAGTWSSFHSKKTGAQTTDGFRKTWYESDYYAGAGIAIGKISAKAQYYIETSPSNAWNTIEELALSGTFDDSELLGKWAMKPTAALYLETGSDALDGGSNGVHLQLGVSPGFTFEEGTLKDVAVSFPMSVGLSMSNYYESPNGKNDFFGYASIGSSVTVPLTSDRSWGSWSLNAGVQGLFLGDAARSYNRGDGFAVIGTLGISVSF